MPTNTREIARQFYNEQSESFQKATGGDPEARKALNVRLITDDEIIVPFLSESVILPTDRDGVSKLRIEWILNDGYTMRIRSPTWDQRPSYRIDLALIFTRISMFVPTLEVPFTFDEVSNRVALQKFYEIASYLLLQDDGLPKLVIGAFTRYFQPRFYDSKGEREIKFRPSIWRRLFKRKTLDEWNRDKRARFLARHLPMDDTQRLFIAFYEHPYMLKKNSIAMIQRMELASQVLPLIVTSLKNSESGSTESDEEAS